jgi:hypothetical protein
MANASKLLRDVKKFSKDALNVQEEDYHATSVTLLDGIDIEVELVTDVVNVIKFLIGQVWNFVTSVMNSYATCASQDITSSWEVASNAISTGNVTTSHD